MARHVCLVDTGVANLASVRAGLARLDATVERTLDPRTIGVADRVALPGVGSFGAGMERLRSTGADVALRNRIEQGRPTLAVCLGMQLLCARSEESPGVEGLGVVDAEVRRFPDDLATPQIGWNRVEPSTSRDGPVTPGWAYFANSYRIVEPPERWETAWTDYGGPFVSAMWRDDVLACQFHPELSGAWGAALLDRWLAGANAGMEREAAC